MLGDRSQNTEASASPREEGWGQGPNLGSEGEKVQRRQGSQRKDRFRGSRGEDSTPESWEGGAGGRPRHEVMVGLAKF